MRRTYRDKRQVLFWILSVIIVLSMVCSFVTVLRPTPRAPEPTPTLRVPTRTPTPRPTLVAATPAPPAVTTEPSDVPTQSTPTATPTSEPTQQSEADPDDASFTFAVCGDSRGGWEVYKRILEQVEAEGAAFLVHLGDMVNSGHEYEFAGFAEFMKGFSRPFYPVPGNHDNGDGLLTAYLKYSGAPAAHYSFDHGPLHLSVIDTSLGDATDRELARLAADLQASGRPLKMVALHHPPFDPAGTDHIMRRGNEAFMALVAEHNVAAVLAGHIHSYDLAVRDGVTYLITGGAGAPLYPEETRPAFHHYVRITVEGTSFEIQVVQVQV